MADKSLVILGGGGHACVLAEAANLSGWTVRGHLALQTGTDPLLGDWLGGDEAIPDVLSDGEQLGIGIGFVHAAGAKNRAMLLKAIPENSLATVIHPSAVVSPSAKIGSGCFVAAGAVIGTGAKLGTGVLVNTGAIVEHHCTVAKNCHIATGARLTGNISIGQSTLIGAGAILRQGLTVGSNAVIGAGAIVLSSVPDEAAWGGNPARPLDLDTVS